MRYINERPQTGRVAAVRTDRNMPERDFDSIYTDFSRLVYWAAYGVLSNHEQTEDVTQNVFISVLKNMDKISGLDDAQLKGWLYRVSVNAALDHKRRSKHEVLSDEPVGADAADLGGTPEDTVVESETSKLVREAIEQLDGSYGGVLKMHYFSEMSVADIAEALGISPGTVKSRLSRGRALLAKALKAKGLKL